MLDMTQRSGAETIVEFFEFLDLDPAVNAIAQEDGLRYHHHPEGRFGSDIELDLFAFGLPAAESVARAQALSKETPHWLEVFGVMDHGDSEVYAAGGYEPLGEWTVMRRALHEPPAPTALPVALATDAATEAMLAELQHARPDVGHRIKPGQHADRRFIQCWIPVDDVAAAIGQGVLLQECVYLCEMVTFPDYRRRGFAGAIFQSLLRYAYERGAREAILVSTPMAHELYERHGFTDVVPLHAFEWRPH